MHNIGPRNQVINGRCKVPDKAIRQDRQYVGNPYFWVQPVRLGGFQDRGEDHAGVGSSLGITEIVGFSLQYGGLLRAYKDALDSAIPERPSISVSK